MPNTRSIARLTAPAVFALAMLAACGGGGDDPSPPPPAAAPAPAPCTAPCVDATGGTIAGPSGAGITVPPGALTSRTTIAITGSATPPASIPSQFSAAGSVYAFEPHGQSFAQPVTIRVPLDPGSVDAGEAAQLLRIESGGTNWSVVSGATRDGNVVSAQVSGFSYFAVVTTLGPPRIVTQPGSVAVTAGEPATFRVGVTRSGNVTYQWLRNGAAIPGATEATYTVPSPSIADDGALYSVAVTNSVQSVTSTVATLMVNSPSATADLEGRVLPHWNLLYRASASDKVVLHDANGVRREAPTDAQGRFKFEDVSALTAPFFLVLVSGDNFAVGMTAVVLEKPTRARAVYVSDLATAVAVGALAEDNFFLTQDEAAWRRTAMRLTHENVTGALVRLRTTLGPVVSAFGGDTATFDPARSSLASTLNQMVQGRGTDAAGTPRFYNAYAVLPPDRGVTRTLMGTALPAPVVNEADIGVALAAALEACFKLPAAERAATDEAGQITALNGPCAKLPVAPDYSNNLSSFSRRFADWILDRDIQDVHFIVNPFAAIDAETVNVNILYFRLQPRVQLDGRLETMRRTSPGHWLVSGNQRGFELYVQPELRRVEYLNPPGSNPTIFQTSHIAYGLHMRFDPSNGTAASNVRAVRVKGRSLPPGGIVLTRSTSCGRYDRFVIANKTGDVSVSSSPNRSSTFVLGASPATQNGPLGTWPSTDPAWIQSPLTGQQFGELFDVQMEPFTMEVFMNGDTTTPSIVERVRIFVPPTGVVPLSSALSQASLAYLTPGTPQAAAQPSLTLEWTVAGTGGVYQPSYAYAFARGDVDGATNKLVFDELEFAPGSRSSVTFLPNRPRPADPNPCAASQWPAATGQGSNFRGFGLYWHRQGARILHEYQR